MHFFDDSHLDTDTHTHVRWHLNTQTHALDVDQFSKMMVRRKMPFWTIVYWIKRSTRIDRLFACY